MECEGAEGGGEMEEEKRGEEKGKCEVMARPETISSTVVIKKADALMSPFLQLKQVNANSKAGDTACTVTVLFLTWSVELHLLTQ